MKSKEKQIAKLQKVLERLSRDEIVQNRKLKTVLGTEHYARYFDDYCEQTQLRDMLKDKPDEIIEYERWNLNRSLRTIHILCLWKRLRS